MQTSTAPVATTRGPFTLLVRVGMVAACICQCDIAHSSDFGLPAANIDEDSRLRRNVNLRGTMQIGAALEALAKSSGVRVFAGERDGAGDPLLFIDLRDTHLYDAMHGLSSLVSYQGATWRWTRISSQQGFEYQLVRPLAARQLANRLQNLEQELFEQQAELFITAAHMSPQQREKFIRSKQNDLYPGRPELADLALRSERKWTGLTLFSTVVPEQSQRAILKGNLTAKMTVSGLPPAGREFVQSVWRKTQAVTIAPDGSKTPIPEPEQIVFRTDRTGAGKNPTLVIDLEGIGAYGYVGGAVMDLAVRTKMKSLWILPGDSQIDVRESGDVKPKSPDTPTSNSSHLQTRLRQFTSSSTISTLVRLPLKPGGDPGIPGGHRVGQFLASLASTNALSHKWRAGVLLLAYDMWFLEEAIQIPWGVAKRLERAIKQNDGLLTIDDLATFAALLSKEQLRQIGTSLAFMNNVADVQELLMRFSQSPLIAKQMKSDSGLTIDRTLVESTASNALLAPTISQSRAVRIHSIKPAIENPDTIQVSIQVFREDKWMDIYRFSYRRLALSHPIP